MSGHPPDLNKEMNEINKACEKNMGESRDILKDVLSRFNVKESMGLTQSSKTRIQNPMIDIEQIGIDIEEIGEKGTVKRLCLDWIHNNIELSHGVTDSNDVTWNKANKKNLIEGLSNIIYNNNITDNEYLIHQLKRLQGSTHSFDKINIKIKSIV